MNAIQYAINHVRNTIPSFILERAFGARNITPMGSPWQQSGGNQSLDYVIRDKVIENRVNTDCNLIGGTQVAIDLSTVPTEQYDFSTRVFRIPFEVTGGRRIVSLQQVAYMEHHGVPAYNYGMSDQRMSAAIDLYNAIKSMPIVATAKLDIIGDNVIAMHDNVQHMSNKLGLLCVVENDQGMNNLTGKVLMDYAKLVEYATKAYIFNNLDIGMDRGQLHAGQQLGRIREIVDEYRDANELYQEYFNDKWQKASFFNDRRRSHDFIKTMLGRGR